MLYQSVHQYSVRFSQERKFFRVFGVTVNQHICQAVLVEKFAQKRTVGPRVGFRVQDVGYRAKDLGLRDSG